MSKNLRDIDDLFKSAINQHQDTPGDIVWENIDKHLDKKKVVFLLKKYRKWKWVAAACLMFSLGMAMYAVHTNLKGKEVARKAKGFTAPASKLINSGREEGTTDEEPSLTNNSDERPTADEQASLTAPSSTGEQSSVIKKLNDSQGSIPGSTNKQRLNANEDLAKANAHRNTLSERATSNTEKIVSNPNTSKLENSIALNSNSKRRSKLQAKAKKDLIAQATRNIKVKPMLNNTASIASATKPKNAEATKSIENYTDIKTATSVELNTASPKANLVTLPLVNSTLLAPSVYNINPLPVSTSNKNVFLASSSKKVKSKSAKAPLFSLTTFYSADFISNRLKGDKPRFREDERNEIKRNEEITAASGFGVLVNYKPGKSISIESGFTQSTIVSDIKPKIIYARPDNRGQVMYRFSCSAGYSYVTLKSGVPPTVGDSIRTLESKNTMKYIGIPLNLRYNLAVGKFSVQPGIGLSANFLTQGNIETVIATPGGAEKVSSSDIQGLKSSYINGALSVGAHYDLNETFALTFLPTLRFGLTSINKDGPVKTNYNSIGIGAGLSVKF
jgi:hypothetical protein